MNLDFGRDRTEIMLPLIVIRGQKPTVQLHSQGGLRAVGADAPREATGCVNSNSHRVKRLETLSNGARLAILWLPNAGNILWTMFRSCLVEFDDHQWSRRAQRGALR